MYILATVRQTVFVISAIEDKTVVFKLCITYAEGKVQVFLTSKYLYEYCFCFVDRVAQIKSTIYYLRVCFCLLLYTYVYDCLKKDEGLNCSSWKCS